MRICFLNKIRSIYNIGAFFRTADGAGFDKVIIHGFAIDLNTSALKKTALGAEKTVPSEHITDAKAYIQELKDKGYTILAVETGKNSLPYHTYTPPNEDICVIFGNEVEGVEAQLEAMADQTISIPMRGEKHSLNVSVAGGIILYHLALPHES